MSLQHLMHQHHGSEIIPNHMIFQDPREGVECQEDGPGAQHHEDRPIDENETANSSNINPGVVNYKHGARNF